MGIIPCDLLKCRYSQEEQRIKLYWFLIIAVYPFGVLYLTNRQTILAKSTSVWMSLPDVFLTVGFGEEKWAGGCEELSKRQWTNLDKWLVLGWIVSLSKKIGGSPNFQYLRMWLYLQTGSLQRWWEGQINAERERVFWGGGESSRGLQRGLHFYLTLTVLNVLCYLFWVLITSSSLLCRQTYLELFGAQCGRDSIHSAPFPSFPINGRLLMNEELNGSGFKKIKWLFPLY